MQWKPTDGLTDLSSHTYFSVTIHDTLSGKPVSLVNQNLERLIEQRIKVLTEKQEVIVANILKEHSYLSDLQMFPDKTKTIETIG